MLHQPLGGFSGQASDIEIHSKEMLRTKDTINKILAENIGKDLKTITRDTDRDFFMSAGEALSYGVVDKVITSTNNR
jgi:ATP-dependent Clp protease, protease subunit